MMKKIYMCTLLLMGATAFGHPSSVHLEKDSSYSSFELRSNLHDALATRIITPRPEQTPWERAPQRAAPPSEEPVPYYQPYGNDPSDEESLSYPEYSVEPEDQKTPSANYEGRQRAAREARREAIRQQRQRQRSSQY